MRRGSRPPPVFSPELRRRGTEKNKNVFAASGRGASGAPNLMTKKMLIDASHAEETRVVVLDGNRLEDFDVEITAAR